MKADRVLGIMSGTSLDGVDYALCSITPKSIHLEEVWSSTYPKAMRQRLWKAAHDQISSYELAQLHHDLGRFYAQHAPKVKCDYVGMHGQTIFHNPNKKNPATFQLGEPAYVAAKLKVPVICQFRTMDLALGGQGAPLATLFHKFVFGTTKQNIAVNNLGGISNVTYLPKSGKILSFDTGPANMLVDQAVTTFTKGKMTYDKDGSFASRGIPSQRLISKWMQHPYFKIKPPKSTGREDFGAVFFKKAFGETRKLKLSPEDTVATFMHFTAQSIAYSYEAFLPHLPDLVILCGGGASNPALVNAIRFALNERIWLAQGTPRGQKSGVRMGQVGRIPVTTSDAFDWPNQAIEAAAFALLAYNTHHELPGNIPETTGALHSAILGQVSPAPR